MTLLTAIDVLGNSRTISCSNAMIDGCSYSLMECTDFNVCTYDFRKGTDEWNEWLPRNFVKNPPDPWDNVGVSAHANTLAVAKFLKEELGHDGLDGNGKMYSSFIHYNGRHSGGGAFHLSSEYEDIFVYCYERQGNQDFYFASGISVVAHEIFHGVTKHVCGLESTDESGALNESYSDIFGVILANRGVTDIENWNWEIGIPSTVNKGFPIRDLSDPGRFGQPIHKDNYQEIVNDQGGVHTNNGIHNKAAYNLLISKDSEGRYLFDANSAGLLFYLALSKFSQLSKFIDSKRELASAAADCFSDTDKLTAVVSAINRAFGDVGI